MTVKIALDPRTMPNGTVLSLGVRYESQTTDKVWTYVALKTGGRWWLTGAGPSDAGWGAVERWLESGGRELVHVDHLTRNVRLWDQLDHLPVDTAQA